MAERSAAKGKERNVSNKPQKRKEKVHTRQLHIGNKLFIHSHSGFLARMLWLGLYTSSHEIRMADSSGGKSGFISPLGAAEPGVPSDRNRHSFHLSISSVLALCHTLVHRSKLPSTSASRVNMSCRCRVSVAPSPAEDLHTLAVPKKPPVTRPSKHRIDLPCWWTLASTIVFSRWRWKYGPNIPSQETQALRKATTDKQEPARKFGKMIGELQDVQAKTTMFMFPTTRNADGVVYAQAPAAS
jgi:hypothetical protein